MSLARSRRCRTGRAIVAMHPPWIMSQWQAGGFGGCSPRKRSNISLINPTSLSDEKELHDMSPQGHKTNTSSCDRPGTGPWTVERQTNRRGDRHIPSGDWPRKVGKDGSPPRVRPKAQQPTKRSTAEMTGRAPGQGERDRKPIKN